MGSSQRGPRVLMFCPQFAPLVGGAERQAGKLARALHDQGVAVRILTPRVDDASPDRESLDGVPVRRFPLSDLSRRCAGMPGIGLVNAPWIVLQIAWRVWRESREADIVHCHIGSLQTVAAAGAAHLRGLPVICKAAMADRRSDLGEAARAGATSRIVAWAGSWAFTRWVATTLAVKDALLRAGVDEARIVVIPNGVELAEPRPCKASGPVKRFLYLGRLSTNANRDVPGLIRAFDALADEVDNVELAIVGGGDLLEDTRRIVATCRHASRIQVPGPGEPATWLAWANCFVLPSRREGLSNALLEAMAAGLPCIAYDIPPNREVLGDGQFGMLVPERQPDALESAMRRLVREPETASSIAATALTRITSTYGIVSVADRYRLLYGRLVYGGRPVVVR